MKKVIYTSLTGNYDNLEEPGYIMKGWDYICFTNNPTLRSKSTWQFKPIPYTKGNNIILSRYPKLNPHRVLKDYDTSIYIDSNIKILTNSLEFRANELIQSNVKLSIAKHPERNCIYEEAKICLNDMLDKRTRIIKHIDFLESEGFPKNYGLYENNIIYRIHNDPTIRKMDEAWWDLYNTFSRRDQLSLAYILWKYNIDCTPLFPENFNIRFSSDFKYLKHKKVQQPLSRRFLRKINQLFSILD